MNNLDCVIAVLTSHREARRWSDEAVAIDLLAQLGLDAGGEAAHATPVIDPSLVTEDEVVAAEAEAKEATEKAEAARHALDAQVEDEAKAKADVAADQAEAAKEAREAAKPEHPAFVPPVHTDPEPAPPPVHVDPAPMIQAEPVPTHP